MEWVETTGKTIEDAKNKALDQLGVAEDDAEFDVVDEPRAGLFGRVRGEARVRARVRPSTPRPKVERRDRKKKDAAPDRGAASGVDSDAVAAESDPAPRARRGASTKKAAPPEAASVVSGANDVSPRKRLTRSSDATRPARTRSTATESNREPKETAVDAEQVGVEAQKFVQGLVDAFGLDGTAGVRRDGDDIEVSVEGSDLGLLVGPRGVTLQAVQDLTRVASQRRLGDHETRLRVDVGGYRERRREALGRFAEQVADQVIAEGAAKRLEPMSSADRKIIHDALSDLVGVVTHSEGDDPRRCVVIAPANG